MDLTKVIPLAIGLVIAIMAAGILVWLMQFQTVFLNPDLFQETNPLGVITIIAILVFGGFYLLHWGFEAVYRSFRG